MQTYKWYWKLGVVSALAVGGAIAWSNDCAKAQITPDNTLGAESSVVTPNVDINGLASDHLDGGAVRGANLFHSFQEFNVSEGRGAYFINPAGIENILSRVTGSNPSDILGTLGVLGNANLFFINPNGIIFGPNASLDVGGSFVASTASSLNLADGNQFSATAPQTTPLLTISVPTGLQFGGNAESVQVQESILQVQAGQTLALVGGNVSVEGGEFGFLSAPEGRIELGGLAGAGMVDIEGQQSEGAFRLSSLRLPDAVERGDVLLTNLAYLDVAGGGGGSIAINARNLDISGGSVVRGGIETNLGFPGAIAGDIELSAQEAIKVANGGIVNNVRTGAVGQGGNINITTGSLSLTNGAQLTASTLGQGNAGNVTIEARDTVSFDDGESVAFSNVEATGIGKGGNINITTGSLSLTNGAQLATVTLGQGNAGNVTIEARDTVSFDGESVAFSNVEATGIGKGGDINITTGSLSLTNGAQLQALTRGQGDAGNLTIAARDTISFDGVSSNGFSSATGSTVEATGVGNGGDINITTRSLSLTNGAKVSAGTRGQGDSGNLTIAARDTISFDGVNSNGATSGAFTQVNGSGAVGNGGDINVTASSLSLTNGAELGASTFGQGDAGSVTITVRDTVSFDGVGSTGFASGPSSNVESGGVGNGSGINITTGSLSLTNGAQLQVTTRGQGDAGSITITARDTVSFDGVSSTGFVSAAFSNVENTGVGSGGNINITTGSLFLTNGAQVGAATLGQGDAGNVTIDARDTISFDGVSSNGFSSAAISTVENTGVGNGGDINITTGSLFLTNGAQVGAATLGQGDAGNVTIDARDTVSSDGVGSNGFNSGVYSNVFVGAVGNGGDINIATGSLIGNNGGLISASSEGSGAAGNIEVAADSIRLDNQALLSSDTTAGQGNIILNSRDLVLRRGSNITTNATGTASGGNITIDAGVLAALEDSDISANAPEGFGGRVIINAQGIFGTDFRAQLTPESDITASSNLGPKFSGTVEINTPDVDLQSSLTQLLANFVSPDQVVAGSCLARRNVERGSFTITGTGGLPSSPYEAMSGRYTVTGVQSIQEGSSTVSSRAAVVETAPWERGEPIQEAQGMAVTADGRTIVGTTPQLVALAKAQNLVCHSD